MHWNYRVTKKKYHDFDEELVDVYNVREVHYDNEGKISWTYEEVGPHGETLEEFMQDFERFKNCVNKSVIDLDEVEKNNNVYDGEQ